MMSDKLRESINILWDRLCYKCGSYNCDMSCEAALSEPAIKESLTVAEQEPVACIGTNGKLMWLKKPSAIYSKPRPLYTAPPRREWVGLTGTEINHIFAENVGYPERMMKEVETLLKDKNT